ncbi:hypothetical protein DL96DRAFT_1120602 [Flagelloscypha sp. PMI_526]|nr:hypothetical protein DL96DRAFT_1120602 [Flagelloscypha sp. PMI_526]
MSYMMGSPDVIAALQNPTPDSLAAFAGATDDGAQENMQLLRGQLGMVQAMPRPLQIPIHYETAARYLPVIVARFRQSDGPYGPAMVMLNTILYTPYFVRFSRLPELRDLPQVQLTRMANNIDQMNASTSADEIGEIGQFLSTLLALLGGEGINQSDVDKLKPQFKTWERRFPGRLAGNVGDRCMMMLSNNREAQMMGMGMRQQLGSSLEECGGPGCSRKTREGGSELLQCARCKIAVYCCSEHQRADWKMHKQVCFKSSF